MNPDENWFVKMLILTLSIIAAYFIALPYVMKASMTWDITIPPRTPYEAPSLPDRTVP
ncbi:hypothetical protein [Limnoglobus roseus]|uniref:Uncharacterized protein n=1 Tax=Limnoglobus roseus TaxID=2598579 RepID=A0A5C1AJH6_9BACT|nr:hypothetical protein [Limnoglobus roseus]QEL19351.1 hypothetical protein PX52LOC_06420 [Limnoglobus roseus]